MIRLMRYGITDMESSVISHNLLVDRETPNQHPIEAISGLRLELNEKYVKPNTGIPISDMGYNPATQEGLIALSNEVDARMIILNSDLTSVTTHVNAIQDFLNNIFKDQTTGVPGNPVINFAYRNGFREEFISEEGDTDFYLINTFIADGKHLKVYRDGELLVPGVDYDEVSDNKVVFKYPLESDIYLSFICESMSIVVSPIHEEIISIANQTEFTLKNTYKPGDNVMNIFVQGLRLECGTDYEEVNPSTIRLLRPPYSPGTKLIFRQEGVQNAGTVLYHEKDYQQKTWKLNYIAEKNQRRFNLTESYIPGTNMINVFVQGLLQWPGVDFDYVEIDDKTIEFNYELEEGENVSVVCTAALYNWSERFVSLQGQTIYELQNVYYTGRDDILVYENGIQLTEGDDYIEISNRAIELVEAPPVGSKITVLKRR